MLDLLRYPESSRVWIYTSSREFTDAELTVLQPAIGDFARQWTSHNRDLHATGGILHNRFLVLVVDESHADASGCSIDTSVRFIKQLEADFSTDFFDRQLFSYLDDGEVYTLHQRDLKEAFQSGRINGNTLFFDNLVQNKGDFIKAWVKPLSSSWLARLVR